METEAPSSEWAIEERNVIYLARSVLAQAAADVERANDEKLQQEARAWLTTKSEGLEIICDLARVDVGYLISRWRLRLGMNQRGNNAAIM
jgi:hypothetical protein